MIGYVLLAVFALVMGCLFAHLAWTGRFKFGTRTLVARSEDPLAFWIVWTIFVGVVVYAYVNFLVTVGSMPGGPFAE